MREMSKIVRTVTNILYPFIILFGFYIIMHGHLTPGGGFQGGAVVASAFALLAISYGALKIKDMLKKENFSVSECSGLFAFIGLAFLGISTAFFYNFLTGGAIFGNIPAGINPGDLNTGGVIPLMNIAVGAEVLSGIGLIILYMFTGGREVKK
jgi:multicomponent Na+:H+ antiporter subunit B